MTVKKEGVPITYNEKIDYFDRRTQRLERNHVL